MLNWFKLRKLRLEGQTKLNDNYLYLFRDISSYIWSSRLNFYEKEEVLSQILDMMLQAQYENTAIEFIVGSDYKIFCENIIGEFFVERRAFDLVLSYIQKCVLIALILISLISAINAVISNNGFSIRINDAIFVIVWTAAYCLFIYNHRRVSIKNYIDSKNIINLLFADRYNNKKKNLYFGVAIVASYLVIKYLIIVLFGANAISGNINISNNIEYILLAIAVICLLEITRLFFSKLKITLTK